MVSTLDVKGAVWPLWPPHCLDCRIRLARLAAEVSWISKCFVGANLGFILTANWMLGIIGEMLRHCAPSTALHPTTGSYYSVTISAKTFVQALLIRMKGLDAERLFAGRILTMILTVLNPT